MKNLLRTFLFVLTIGSMQAQCNTFDYEISTTSFESYTVNSGSNGFFLPYSDNGAGINLVDDEFKSVIYSGAAWVAGLDKEGLLRVTSAFFEENLNSGYYSDDDTPVNCDDWNRTFQVTKEEVDQVIADFDDNGEMDNVIPFNILYYPAIGNALFENEFGFPLPEENIGGLAPFVDRNNDGFYNAEQGDYPIIKGDVANYNFVHDRSFEYEEVVEVEMNMQSNHWSIRDSTLQNSYDMQITYQGKTALTDAYITLWLDADNVCYESAHIGCLPDNNIAFMYNNYEDGCDGLILDMTTTQTPMVIAEGTVDGNSMSSFIKMNRQNSGMTPPGTWFPQTDQEYYNYMQGKWRDGIPLTYGGDGYNVGSTDSTSYLLDHSENGENERWSSCGDGDNFSDFGDKHFLLNFGPLTLEPNQLLDIKLNTYFIYNTGYTCPSEEQILEQLNRAKDPIIVNTEKVEITEEKIIVSPNPFSNEIALVAASTIQEIEVYDLQGRKVYHTKNIDAKSINILTNSWISGVYTLKVKTDKTVQLVKVIKL